MGREVMLIRNMIDNFNISYWQFHDAMTEFTNGVRAMHSKVDSPQFENLWKQSTVDQRKEAVEVIQSGDREKLKDWMETHPALKAEEWGYNRLRDRAAKLGVKNYSRITREELIREIMEKESANEKD